MQIFMTAAVLVAALAYTRIGSAQAAGDATGRHETTASLRDSQMVRVAGLGLGRREGRLLSASAQEIVLEGDQPLRIPATGIDTIWTRGSSTRTGGLLGGLVGAGLGFLAATQFGEDDAENPGAAFFVGGLAGGGLIGAFIGSGIPRWNRRYP